MMTVKTLARGSNGNFLVEVEVALVPGLPQIHISGLPDAQVRESPLRIKSALRAQGFELPKAKQILVHLRPAHLKKSCRGMDLAIAIAILLKTKQIFADPALSKPIFAFGELSVDGSIVECGELVQAQTLRSLLSGTSSKASDKDEGETLVIVGPMVNYSDTHFEIGCLGDLKNLDELSPAQRPVEGAVFRRPFVPQMLWTENQARLMEILAVGRHAALIAGPPGSGKTTLADCLIGFLPDPSEKYHADFLEMAELFEEKPGDWYPLVRPHHSMSSLGLVGGGVPISPGEISRAHGGILFLDEFLEFAPAVQEALREPVETGRIRLRRGRARAEFPCRLQLLAATNLCPCGKFVPGEDSGCVCYSTRRDNYLARLRGPMTDRFDVVAFSQSWVKTKGIAPNHTIFKRVKSASEFRVLRTAEATPSELAKDTFEQTPTTGAFSRFQSLGLSHRRIAACLRVARTIADIEESQKVESSHVAEALRWTVDPIVRLHDLPSSSFGREFGLTGTR